MKIFTRFFAVALIAAALLVSTSFVSTAMPAADEQSATKERDRLDAVATMLQEIMDAPDKGVPGDLMQSCAALVLIPGVKKGAFILGGEFGRGIMVVRQENRTWGAPGFITIGGGSIGFQIGGQSTDVLLVVRNRKGIEKLINNKFKLGADASVAAGPVGRNTEANTDAQMQAQILSYSRSQGVFAGLSLEGAVLKLDGDANKAMYGRKLAGSDILNSTFKRPESAKKLYELLRKYTG